jgi:hypothetical protein
LAVFSAVSGSNARASLMVERLLIGYEMAQKLLQAQEKSEYQVAKLLKALE